MAELIELPFGPKESC